MDIKTSGTTKNTGSVFWAMKTCTHSFSEFTDATGYR